MDIHMVKAEVIEWIDRNKQEFYDAADFIWENPELSLHEFKACSLFKEMLSRHGFSIEAEVGKLPTAFIATWGDGGPVMGVNAEYDALPGLSQQKGCTVKTPIPGREAGQGCGHNLLGTAEVMAAVALRHVLEKKRIPATLKVFGSPAEELCIGKPRVGSTGAYGNVDFFLDWHPWSYNRADYDRCNAYFSIKYHFEGNTAHGNSPWNGRSALDGAMLMAHAVEMLREHIEPAAADAANTINFTFTDTGPQIPSVVPDKTTLWCVGRFVSSELAREVIQRLDNCALGGATATGTRVKREFITATHEKIPNKTLAQVVHSNFTALGPPAYTQEEHEMVKQMQKSQNLEPVGIDLTIKEFGSSGTALCDTSEFSWNAPYATFWLAMAPGGGWHNWMVTACAGSSIGKKALTRASEIIATSAIDILTDETIIREAKDELKRRKKGEEYHTLLAGDKFLGPR